MLGKNFLSISPLSYLFNWFTLLYKTTKGEGRILRKNNHLHLL